MSLDAIKYASSCLDEDDELSTAARLVLYALADRANRDTGEVPTGEWLEARTALSRSSIWRAMVELRRSGIVRVIDREGTSRLVRFPVVSKLSTPVASTRQASPAHPSRWRDVDVAPARRVPVFDPSVNEFSREGEGVACACDDTGWIFDPATRTVSPCPSHPARCRGAGS